MTKVETTVIAGGAVHFRIMATAHEDTVRVHGLAGSGGSMAIDAWRQSGWVTLITLTKREYESVGDQHAAVVRFALPILGFDTDGMR